jgi:hypothetical protein
MNRRNFISRKVLVVCGLQTERQSWQVVRSQVEILAKLSPCQLLVAYLVISSTLYDSVEKVQKIDMFAADSGFGVEVSASLLVVRSELCDEFVVLGGIRDGGFAG